MANNRYCVDYAKLGTASCKECKKKIEKGLPRIGKIIPNPFTDAGGDMKQWFHLRCAFIKLTRAKAATKKIDSPDDLEGFDDVSKEVQDEIIKYIEEFSVSGVCPKRTKKSKENDDSPKTSSNKSPTGPSKASGVSSQSCKDNSFREFRRLIAKIADENQYTEKTAIIKDFFEHGSDGNGFKGDLLLWVKMLLPSANKKVYYLQNKQIIKLFSEIFGADLDEMLEDSEQAQTVAETIFTFFESSRKCTPAKKSTLTLHEVDEFLNDLSKVSKEEQQKQLLKNIAKRCTANDLKTIILLIKHDLRIGISGPKHVLEAIHPSAYPAFQASRNLEQVISQTMKLKKEGIANKDLRVDATLMTPVLPMLAAPCKKIEQAFNKCPKGMFVEIKYDGERVQVHKKGSEFRYFSRSLKPVVPGKILHLKDYIPKAFPHGNNLILDSEILLVNKDGKPLPFGTLGAHKQKDFKDANVCLFVFDCIQFNDESLLKKTLIERRKILVDNMKPVKNRVILSELKEVKDAQELKRMIKSAQSQRLEGLMIKGKDSVYEPGKRHWLKIKKDYLDDGAMADTADLVVLGAFYGTGNWGGKKSIFLMGCYDEESGQWCTVTKVHSGLTESNINKLQKEFESMKKISKDISKVPSWLNINKALVPDFVVSDPNNSQVWEITGAEFTKTDIHTAHGISIRFPRVTKMRVGDKSPKDATTLKELLDLYQVSQETTDLIGLSSPPSSPKNLKPSHSSDESDKETSKKKKSSPSPKKSSPKSKKRKHSGDDSDLETPKKKVSSSSKKSATKNTQEKCSRGESNKETPTKKKSSATAAKKLDLDQKIGYTDESKAGGKKESANLLSTSKLVDIFSDVRLFLPTTVEEYDVLKRYFIAYNGILLKDHQLMSATHVINTGSMPVVKCPNSACQVGVKWLWDCIKLQKRIPVDAYTPNILKS